MYLPKPTVAMLVLAPIAGFLFAGCTSRMDTPVRAADSTLVYPSRTPGAPAASITLCRALSKKTGLPVDEGSVFVMSSKAKVHALVTVENRAAMGSLPLMFHLVWMGPGDDEIFRKRLDLAPADTGAVLESSLSIPPDRRDPGRYALQVYLFRELIAQKEFELQLGDERPATTRVHKKRSDV